MDRLTQIKVVELRKKWGFDCYTPINLLQTAIDKIDNLTLIWMPLKENFGGCSYKNENNSLILINSIHSKGRQNFTIAHEIYHLLYDDESFGMCDFNNKSGDENLANEFASGLLMPEYALYDFMSVNNIEKWSIDDIIRCEQYYQISHNVFLDRLKSDNLITDEEFREFKKDIVKKATLMGYDVDLYLKSNEKHEFFSLGKIIPLTEKIFRDEKISKGKKRDILSSVFRQDIIFNNFNG
ncbi:MAG: ImmA/IrrE family metallo-endopeptidase [Methanobrevibacter sp.]|nr:ImmA/IrrE family metallo-endopeptidase [Methanobrevibacter sp.]